jgi:hypothetical protein
MKEIDFLPKWYKDARRRKTSYRMQYAVVLCVFAAMVGWSFFTAKSVSDAQANTQQQKLSTAEIQSLEECAQINLKLAELVKHGEVLNKLGPKVSIANVLAELSFLVDSRIVLTQIDIQAEEFENGGQSDGSAGLVRVAKNVQGSSAAVGNVRYKVVLQGMACEAGDVAKLICKLEESPYFCRVIPGFSRTAKIKERQVSEFETACYLANYKGAKR